MAITPQALFADPALFLYELDESFAVFQPMTRQDIARSIFLDGRIRHGRGDRGGGRAGEQAAFGVEQLAFEEGDLAPVFDHAALRGDPFERDHPHEAEVHIEIERQRLVIGGGQQRRTHHLRPVEHPPRLALVQRAQLLLQRLLLLP